MLLGCVWLCTFWRLCFLLESSRCPTSKVPRLRIECLAVIIILTNREVSLTQGQPEGFCFPSQLCVLSFVSALTSNAIGGMNHWTSCRLLTQERHAYCQQPPDKLGHLTEASLKQTALWSRVSRKRSGSVPAATTKVCKQCAAALTGTGARGPRRLYQSALRTVVACDSTSRPC